MSTFGLDKNYQQFNFEEISVDELEIISGGSGQCVAGVLGGALAGGGAALAAGAAMAGPWGWAGAGAAAIGGGLLGAAANCFGK